MKQVRLNNGVMMPSIGFGVFQIPQNETERVVAVYVSPKSIYTFSKNMYIFFLKDVHAFWKGGLFHRNERI